MTNISDDALLKLIIAADDEELETGKAPKARSLLVVPKVMERLGHKAFILLGPKSPPIAKRIFNLYESLYRTSDLAVGGVHGGIFMFRDVFARIYIPFGYGTLSINPFKLTDLSPMQLKWLSSRPRDVQIFLDQFTDIFDFSGPMGNFAQFKVPPKESLDLMRLAAFQFQAAAATLSVAFDFRGAVQSALIGTELALKGGLVATGINEAALKGYGHNLASAAKAYAKAKPDFDLERVLTTLKRLPPYVENRYSPNQPSRIETGHIVMGAQYVAGGVMRQVTGFSIRAAAQTPTQRVYP